jgi:Alternative complex III, ActD subunit
VKGIYGLMAEFHSPTEVVEAAKQVRAAGYRKVDGYSPFPIEELSEALEFDRSPLSKIVLVGGILGLSAGWGLEYWASVIAYPMNIGGRPYNSWPAFLVPAFETTILFAALFAVLGMLGLNGLPEPYHPVFNVPGFALASRDKFFLCIESKDPKFDPEETRRFLEGLEGTPVVSEVPH